MDATGPQADSGRTRVRSWTSLALLAGLILIYLVVVNRPGREMGTVGPAIGRHLLYLRLEPLTAESRPVELDDLAGRVTVLNYWGTWCGPCRLELPEIVSFASRYGGRDDFRLYAVSCGQNDDHDLGQLRATTAAFLANNHVELPTYADQNQASRSALVTLLGLSDGFSYPTTVIFDRQGAIRGFWQGYSPRGAREMERLIDELLKTGSGAAS